MQIHRFKLLCILLLAPLYLHAAVSAKVDQSTIYQGEKLTLTIETNQTNESRPDLRALQNNYSLLGTKKITLSQHSTGSVVTKTRWEILIRPTSEGELLIPAIKVGPEMSLEIPISVLPAAQNPAPSEGALRPIFLDVELDKDTLYINGQAILKAQIYHLAPLPLDANLTAPESKDALIKPLEEQKKYTTIVRGQRYTVTENSYTVFPREEGDIEISPLFFSATLSGDSVVELNSSPLIIAVLPKAFTNERNLWLPAKSIHIEDNLPTLTQAEVGSTFNRIITMEAEGLPASALPSLSALQNELATIKLLNVVLEEQMTETGIISQRIEELEISPKELGELTLPAIDIPWWNTEVEKGKTASLSARTINVSPASASEIADPMKNKTMDGQAPVTSTSNSKILIWLLTIISMLTTLGCIYSFNRLRVIQKASQQTEAELLQQQDLRKQVASDIAERNTFQALSMACNQNNPEIAQLRLIEWAQSFWKDNELHSLEQVCEYAQNQTFNFLVLDLEQHLYSQNPDLWQGDLLLEAIDKLRNRHQRQLLDMQAGDKILSY